jgi:hypothetical protein
MQPSTSNLAARSAAVPTIYRPMAIVVSWIEAES